MRKLLLYSILLGVMCLVYGCGMGEEEETVKSAGEQALELQQKAEDAVGLMNEDTMKMNETADAIEE